MLVYKNHLHNIIVIHTEYYFYRVQINILNLNSVLMRSNWCARKHWARVWSTPFRIDFFCHIWNEQDLFRLLFLSYTRINIFKFSLISEMFLFDEVLQKHIRSPDNSTSVLFVPRTRRYAYNKIRDLLFEYFAPCYIY